MKKHFIFCALAVLALSSCVKENASQPEVSDGLETITFEAAASADTKTTLVDGTKVYWTADDQISVMGAAEPFTNALAAGETAAKTAFTGEVAAADTYYAVYPASGVTWNGTVATTSLVTTQLPVKGTFSNGYNVTVAKTTSQEKSFPFKNVLGYVKFSLTETTLRSVIVTANGGECLTGKFTVDAASDDPEIVPGTGRSYVQFTEYNVRSFSEGDYYIALLPGTYSQGLTFEFENKEGVIATARLEGPVTLEAGNIQNIGSVDSLTWGEKDASENVIWTGKFFVEGWKGCQDLAWGGFDWSRAKAGDVLKVYGGPESEGLGWWCICLKDARNWENLPGTAQYDNPTDISLTLTQEMIDKLVETGGLVLQGQDYVFTKIELVPGTGAGEDPGTGDEETEETFVVWEGSQHLGPDWGNGNPLNLEYFRSVVPGSVLYIEAENEEGASFKLADLSNGWANMPGTDYYGWQSVTGITLTDEAVDIIRSYGLVIQGIKTTITKVYFTYPSDAVVREDVEDTDIIINSFDQNGDHNAYWDNSWDNGPGTGKMNGDNGYVEITSDATGWVISCNHQTVEAVDDISRYDFLMDVYVPEDWCDEGLINYQLVFGGEWNYYGAYMLSTLIGNGTWQTVRVDLSKIGNIKGLDAMSNGANGFTIDASLPVGMRFDNLRFSLKK